MTPANASVVLNRTAIAAVCKSKKGVGAGAIRVYTQDVHGGIREAGYDGSGTAWWGGNKVIGTGKIGSPLAAAATPGLEHIRLYYITPGFKLAELCYEESDSGRGWFEGALTGKEYPVAPYSQIAAAYTATGGLNLRVYVQAPDNSIQEYSADGAGWYKDQVLGTACPGSSIAVTSYNVHGNLSIHLYFQAPNLDLVEKAHDTYWETGSFFVPSAPPRAALSATSWSSASGPGIRVYYSGANDTILEKATDGTWYDGEFSKKCVPGSQIGCASWLKGSEEQHQVRVYFQGGVEVTAVSEWKRDGLWIAGAGALPPAEQM